eukprot:8709115-Pyramimonas_sp.AAC.1
MCALWAAVGDWNNAPDQFRRTKWLRALKGELLLPTGCEITCTSGKGRVLDYGVCSRNFPPLIKSSTPVRNVPWGPRIGLHSELRSRPAAIFVQGPMLPVKLDIPNAIIKVEKGVK